MPPRRSTFWNHLIAKPRGCQSDLRIPEQCGQLAPGPSESRYGGPMRDDLEGLGDPTCARCLVRLEIAGSPERPFWRCPVCGLVSL